MILLTFRTFLFALRQSKTYYNEIRFVFIYTHFLYLFFFFEHVFTCTKYFLWKFVLSNQSNYKQKVKCSTDLFVGCDWSSKKNLINSDFILSHSQIKPKYRVGVSTPLPFCQWMKALFHFRSKWRGSGRVRPYLVFKQWYFVGNPFKVPADP